MMTSSIHTIIISLKLSLAISKTQSHNPNRMKQICVRGFKVLYQKCRDCLELYKLLSTLSVLWFYSTWSWLSIFSFEKAVKISAWCISISLLISLSKNNSIILNGAAEANVSSWSILCFWPSRFATVALYIALYDYFQSTLFKYFFLQAISVPPAGEPAATLVLFNLIGFSASCTTSFHYFSYFCGWILLTLEVSQPQP